MQGIEQLQKKWIIKHVKRIIRMNMSILFD